jgi:hypothetical protein
MFGIPRSNNGVSTSGYLDVDIVFVWFVIRSSRGRRSLYRRDSHSSGILEADRVVLLDFHDFVCEEGENSLSVNSKH